MNLSQQYPVSKELAYKGVEVDLGGAIFILAYYNSSQAQMFFHAELEKFKKDNDPSDAVILAMRSTLVNKVILGWSNLQEDDVEIAYSKSECERILDTYEGLDVTIMGKSMDINKYKEQKKVATEEK